MVGRVLSQKPRRLQRFRNKSSFARSDAETRPCRETVRDLGEDGGAKHAMERHIYVYSISLYVARAFVD